jgi:dihydrofolate reductase
MKAGTTFHFVSGNPQEVLEQALAVAGNKDVRIGGGPTVIREYLKAGLVDQLHVAITPIILGSGINLWDDLRGLESDSDVRTEVSESGTIHITFSRK